MNRHDDRFSRGRRSEYERDEWRERDRQGREPSRESFHPGNYGFEEGEYSGRTAGGAEQQPFSRNPYGYYPGQDRSRDEWRDRDRDRGSRERYGSQRFGQREPYNTRGDYSRSGAGPFQGEYEEDYGRHEDYGRRGMGGSRYSESQYSAEPGGGRYGSGYERWRDAPRTQGESRMQGEEREYGRGRYGSGYGSGGRYGSGVEARYGEERGFGEGPFADTTEAPGYFGMGNYGDGGASSTGGFDQRTRPRNYGSLGEDTFSAGRDWGSSNRGWRESPERRFRTGPKGYTRSDDRMREDICERLMLANSVDSSEVTVTVKEGQVTLEGSVPNRRMKHTIEDLVDAAPGVQDIDNRIRVESSESRYGSSSYGTGGGAGASAGGSIGSSAGTAPGMGSTTQRTSSQGTSTGTSTPATSQGAAGSSTSTGLASGSSSSGSGQRRKE